MHETMEKLKKKLMPSEETPKNAKEKARVEKKCKLCEATFSLNCDLEKHMDTHEAEQKYRCNTCAKTFHLEWRFKKHEENHNRINVKHCKYYSKQELCPFEAIGCQFLHIQTEFCRLDDCQDLLCPFNHQNVINNEEAGSGVGVAEHEDQEEVLELEENQCHLCRIKLQTKDDLYDHVQMNHEEYFLGMIEVAARMSSSIIE